MSTAQSSETSANYAADYSQYQGYQYPTGAYSTTQGTTPAASAGYAYGSYNYSQTAYSSYDGYTAQGYSYPSGYDYSAYSSYYTQPGTTAPTTTPTVATAAGLTDKATGSVAGADQTSSLSSQAPPPPPPAPQGGATQSSWGAGAGYPATTYSNQSGYYGSQSGSYSAYGQQQSAYGQQPQGYSGTIQQQGYTQPSSQLQSGYSQTGSQAQSGYSQTGSQAPSGYSQTGTQQQGYSQQQTGYTAQSGYKNQSAGQPQQQGYNQPSQEQRYGQSSAGKGYGQSEQRGGYGQGDYGQTNARDSKTGDNANSQSAYYSGIQGTSSSRGSYSGGRGRGDSSRGGFDNNRGADRGGYGSGGDRGGYGRGGGSGDRGGYGRGGGGRGGNFVVGNRRNSYNSQSEHEEDLDKADEFDARNYRDSSQDTSRGDRGRGRGVGQGGFSDRGRGGGPGSGRDGLRGQWADDKSEQGPRNFDKDNSFRGGRGGGRGFDSDRGRGRGFGQNAGRGRGFEDRQVDNDRNSPQGFGSGYGEQAGRGDGVGERGGYGRGGSGRGSEQGLGREEGMGRGGFGRGGNQTRGGFNGRGRGGRPEGRQEIVDIREDIDEAPETSDKPWINTDKPVLKRVAENVSDSSPTKKKKEEEKVDVLPFIQAHIEEHCTVNEEARKLAEEALKKMMQPAYCVLCNARMSGPPQAVMHYQGKNHNKKIKNFITCGMTKYAEKVKEDENKTEEEKIKEKQEEEERNRILDQKVAEARVMLPVDSQDSDFCKLCCVEFSAPSQAEQHYQGKNHQKRLRQLGPGAAEEMGDFVCETCNVRVNSQEILNQHMNGAKHKSKAAREKAMKGRDDEYIVPEGGLVVEGGPRLRPGQRVPWGFKVKPYREPTQNEDFTRRFEGPASFFSDNPEPIPPPEEEEKEETASQRKRQKMKKPRANYYDVI